MDFKLTDYLDEIRAIASRNGCTLTAAVDRMIINLNTFNEYNVGTGTLNYHILGHYWGALTSASKISQKKDAKMRLTKQPKTYSARNRRR